jgi:predicted HTH domain antitoxin
MATANTERIEIDLPGDLLFAMRGSGKPDMIPKKMKLALAVFLFQEESISLGKAAELAEMSRAEFAERLQSCGIAAYNYSETDFRRDAEAVRAYREAAKP